MRYKIRALSATNLNLTKTYETCPFTLRSKPHYIYALNIQRLNINMCVAKHFYTKDNRVITIHHNDSGWWSSKSTLLGLSEFTIRIGHSDFIHY